MDNVRVGLLAATIALAGSVTPGAAVADTSVKASSRGVEIASADGNFQFRFSGLIQGDARFFEGSGSPNDTFLLRRVRPTFQGNLGPLVAFRITPEYAADSGSLIDGYLDLRFSPAATLRAGKVKGPVSLERLQGGGALALTERAFPTELAPNRDLGVQLQGDLLDKRLNYVVGVYNGTPDGRNAPNSDADDDKEFAARLFAHPFANDDGHALKGLGIGIAGSIGDKEGAGNNFLPRYRSPAQETVFQYRGGVEADGEHSRLSPQAYFYHDRFGVLAEYIYSEQELTFGAASETFKHDAWQVTTTFSLTGEKVGYNGITTPNRPYGAGGRGAVELALRISELNIDDDVFPIFADPADSVEQARTYGIGLNWHLTSNVKIAANYLHTRYDGGSAGGDRSDEKVGIARLQVAF